MVFEYGVLGKRGGEIRGGEGMGREEWTRLKGGWDGINGIGGEWMMFVDGILKSSSTPDAYGETFMQLAEEVIDSAPGTLAEGSGE